MMILYPILGAGSLRYIVEAKILLSLSAYAASCKALVALILFIGNEVHVSFSCI